MLSAVLAIVNLSVWLTDRLTVWPSVTRWYKAKPTQATITGSSLEDSPMTLVSSWLTSERNSKGNIGSEGAKWERGRKNWQFLANKSPYLGNGLVDLNFNDYFALRVDSITRGHKYKLFKNYSRLNIRKHFFTETVVPMWKNLECDIINFSNLRSFKQSLMMCDMSKYVNY